MKFFVPAPRVDRAPKSLATGSSDSLGRGMDVALTLAVFLGLGWLLDRWLGTSPLFMIVLTVVAAVGQFIRMKYVYDAQMVRLEAERLAGRADRSGRRSPLEDAA
jgi:F0F1-type ATP synthase assembly protein I